MSDPREALGVHRTSETLFEALLPMMAMSAVLYAARLWLGTPTASRPLSPFELLLTLGFVTIVISWYVTRQLTIIGVRSPWKHVLWALGVASLCVGGLSVLTQWVFADRCTDVGGVILSTTLSFSDTAKLCQVGGVPGNPYLPGRLLRPVWDGQVSAALAVLLVTMSVLTSVGLRHVRLRRTRMGMVIADRLRLAPAAGSAASAGVGKTDVLQACGNATLWGEPCGQLYPKSKVFEPGEWCVRCAQIYQPAERKLTFSVVSLFTREVDVLNGLERLDALSWPQGEAPPPDARLSGQERWVRLGQIEVPDVISVATLLQLVHERMKEWGLSAPDDAKPAFALAREHASRIAGWIWAGSLEHRLTYARPTTHCLLAYGPTRLRDLPVEAGESLVLQLDVGLLPLELRTGFRQTFLDPDRAPVLQNLKQDLWVPTTALRGGAKDGLWVPRIEGNALRTWLSIDRLRPDHVRGVASPRPYVPTGEPPWEDEVPEGSLDLVRLMTLDGEPLIERIPGSSVAEWAWMEDRQIELLRQQPLVMVVQ